MSTCSRCGAAFECGMADSTADAPCWCTELPALPPSAYPANGGDPAAASCLCPQCLRALVAMQPAS